MIKSFGLNTSGQLGIDNISTRDDKSRPISFGNVAELYKDTNYLMTSTGQMIQVNDVKDIQCGGTFSIVLKYDGTLYMCGTLNNISYPVLDRIEYTYPLKIISISAGRKHILALMESGMVLSWGSNSFGQLGLGNDTSWDNPKLIHFLDPKNIGCRVIQVSCGGSHSGVITDTGRVFLWGFNKSGQCGNLKSIESITLPSPVDTTEILSMKAAFIVCGRNHTAILTTENRVFVCGAVSYGRLGLKDCGKNRYYLTEIIFFRTIPIHSIASGDYHMLALSHDGSLYSWGFGSEGQTGLGTLLHTKSPNKIENIENCIQICCGYTWSVAITKEGYLYSWGYGDGGWLGIKPSNTLPYVDADNITDNISCDHVLTKSFESDLNVLVPQKVISLDNYVVEKVRCGAVCTIVFLSHRKDISENTNGNSANSKYNIIRGYFGNRLLSKDLSYNNINLFSQESTEETVSQMFLWCRLRKIDEINYALNNINFDINSKDINGNSFLIVATQNGHINVVKMLVDRKINLNITNNKGNTALHYAFAYGFESIAEYLIKSGADEYILNNDSMTCYEGTSSDNYNL